MARKPKQFPDKIMLSEVDLLKAENAILKHEMARQALAQATAAGDAVFAEILKGHGVGAEDDAKYRLDLPNKCMIRVKDSMATIKKDAPVTNNGHSKIETPA